MPSKSQSSAAGDIRPSSTADDPEVVARYSRIPTGRVLVNTPAIMGGMGYSTDLEPSFMLGTGTWSGSITSDNVTALHLINIKRVAYESRPGATSTTNTASGMVTLNGLCALASEGTMALPLDECSRGYRNVQLTPSFAR